MIKTMNEQSTCALQMVTGGPRMTLLDQHPTLDGISWQRRTRSPQHLRRHLVSFPCNRKRELGK